MKKGKCLICGHCLERYPNSGEPLVCGSVCLSCNNDVIVPYRYFLATFKSNRWALFVRQGKARIIETSDGCFTEEDLELYLGKGIRIQHSPIPGLCLALPKEYPLIQESVGAIVLKALKGIGLRGLILLPEETQMEKASYE